VARKEQDREDILREATALTERIEVELPGYAEPIVVGFRPDGSASFFIGFDLVFQFNSKHQLRRAYVAGQLIKAERGQLVALEKHSTKSQIRMLKTELDSAATVELLANAATHLQVLGDHLRAGTCEVRRQVPDSVDVATRVRDWLTGLSTPITVAARPHVS
jgi:hypothetical protein